jgi:hypothetical protein
MGLLNLIVLTFEILFYSMFMKFAMNEGKFYRYVLLFLLATILICIFNQNNLVTYFVFVATSYVGLKYIVNVKTSLYDMLVLLIMLFVKLFIEYFSVLIFFNIIGLGHITTTMIFDYIKTSFIILTKDKIRTYYIKMKKLWDNNNFYIRYIFSCLTFIYVIVTAILLILD